MEDKILFWQNREFIQFGLAEKLQSMHNCELYAIVDDVNDYLKKFFQEQEIIDFQKIWYYTDHVSIKDEKPDLKYLTKIEENYKINLWSIAYVDRIFYSQFNKYHKFSHNEILCLLEQECKFYENLLKEINPDFLIIPVITKHHALLLYKLCKFMGIKTLTYESTHFGDKWVVTDEIDKMIDGEKYKSIKSESKRSFQELQNYLKKFKPDIYGTKSNPRYKITKLNKLKAASKFFSSGTGDYENHFSSYGKNRSSVLKKGTGTAHTLNKKEKEKFIKINLKTEITGINPFLYFPLAYEPERAILLGAPFFSNQISVISNIAKSLPVGYELFVKEHPGMEDMGWREISFYKQILELPNVKLFHPGVSHEDLIKKSSLTITIRGTAGLEAAFYEKPSIVFNIDSGYTELPSVHLVKNSEEIPSAIRSSLGKKVLLSDVNKYVDYIEKYAVDYEQVDFTSEIANKFGLSSGYLTKINISPKELKSFLGEYDSMFERLSSEYLKKIKELKTTN